MAIQINQLVRIDLEIRNRAGALTDPTALYLVIRIPQPSTGSFVQYVYNSGDLVIVRVNQGIYFANFTPELAGKFNYMWESTGTAQGSTNGSFSVESNPFYAPDGTRYPGALP
jgi:hypothetical protein